MEEIKYYIKVFLKDNWESFSDFVANYEDSLDGLEEEVDKALDDTRHVSKWDKSTQIIKTK